MTYPQGIDISKHQGSVDMSKVAAAGMRFVICKATEGVTYTDPKFFESWRDLVKMGPTAPGQPDRLYRGAYHFARPDNNPGRAGGEAEGKNFASVLKQVSGFGTGAFCLALDFEKRIDDVAGNIAFIRGWLHVVEQELGRRPWIYAGPNIWNFSLGDSDAFIDYPLWIPRYSNTLTKPPRMPKSSTAREWPWTLWQWSGGGDGATPLPGVGVVDMNRFNGTEDDLAAFADLRAPVLVRRALPRGGIMPSVDLATIGIGKASPLAARLQGLLMSHGLGPVGLVGGDGLPDGMPGRKTLEAYAKFRAAQGLPDSTLVDPEAWYRLLAAPEEFEGPSTIRTRASRRSAKKTSKRSTKKTSRHAAQKTSRRAAKKAGRKNPAKKRARRTASALKKAS